MIKYKISDELRRTFEFDMLAGLLNMTYVLESDVMEPEFFFIDEDNNNERHGG